MFKKGFVKLIMKAMLYGAAILAVVIGVNCAVDASSVIRPQHTRMAKLALDGNIVAVPENYNERVFQVCIVNNRKRMPETLVIGSSRGMFLGADITGYEDLYNCCVSGACIEDYYALLGLYFEKYKALPKRVIIETSPWVFYADNPEQRWKEDGKYHDSACLFFQEVNGTELAETSSADAENPYISLAYFRYNLEQWQEQGSKVFEEDARISTDASEAADYPDGTIRYQAALENESEERLAKVQSTTGACTYENSDEMLQVDPEKSLRYEKLIEYLLDHGTEVILYMQPFSVTQCRYSFDENLNPGFSPAYDYLVHLAREKGIDLRGGYDARSFALSDERFIDYMHLDREGTKAVWEYGE